MKEVDNIMKDLWYITDQLIEWDEEFIRNTLIKHLSNKVIIDKDKIEKLIDDYDKRFDYFNEPKHYSTDGMWICEDILADLTDLLDNK